LEITQNKNKKGLLVDQRAKKIKKIKKIKRVRKIVGTAKLKRKMKVMIK